ncbi:MAG: VCBS repeat-containing protein [Salinibacter sp.]|uniref:VCBS repeat-containing protein n=1 Tax=Salinibacter sp. TaxID=2065818 RepID=UPI002FC2BB0A
MRFVNEVVGSSEANLLTYENFFNGGGVAVGDLNGDGLTDIYFTANQDANALYLNEGELQFREVTGTAGVRDSTGWKTGVTMADVNGDGLLDIYVSHAGPSPVERRRNKLYLNQGPDGNGVPQFEERAKEYGIDDPGYTTHATFFDYDRDGDLDVYVLNNQSPGPDTQRRFGGDRLYRHDTSATGPERFVNVSGQAGLTKNPIGHGLSATVSDINRDGWLDLYVANDFEGEDRLYVNQGDGTFTDAIHSWVDHMSTSSMGADIADYNNDGRPDIFVLDMLAKGNRRQKLLAISPTPLYRDSPQYTRNMLQLNNGNGTFSEIGQLAGVSNTDWSWAALFADFNLNGLKDLYVTNGVPRDQTNLDFQYGRRAEVRGEQSRTPSDLYELAQKIPSTPIPNYVFRNEGNLTFEDVSTDWGLAKKGFSNGAAYADFDRDGDLDLIVSNVSERAWVYRNNAAERTDRHSLRVELEGTDKNRFGIGAKVTLKTPEGETHYQEMMPVRGFQSSVEPVLTFGLGKTEEVDLTVRWPDQTRQSISDVRVDQTVTLYQEEATPLGPASDTAQKTPLFAVSSDQKGLSFSHRENAFEDYHHEPLLPHKLSRLGPALTRGDINGDGRKDVFVGGARGQSGLLFLQRPDGTFRETSGEAFAADRSFEDVDATFFDADGDGDLDLYVVSGGSSEVRAEAYQDRLYLNDGTGAFKVASSDVLPTIESSGGTVAVHDYDGDGNPDLFVGGRVRPNDYPLPPRSYLLENTGGRFKDVTDQAAEVLLRPGMVTDARWHDLTGNGTHELILAGEWMGFRVFQPDHENAFAEITGDLDLERSSGWWYAFQIADFDGDGDDDIVAGNRGENAQFHARPDAPASVYAGDFDQDGGIEPIMSHYLNGTEYPLPRRDLLMGELPFLRARFQSYEAYAEATMEQVLTQKQWERARRFKAHTFTTSLFEQQKDGTFTRHDLPVEAQFSPTRDLVLHDVNSDGRPDLLMAGNDFTVRDPWGPSDAGEGVLLLNREGLSFEALRARESGFFASGDVRSLLLVPMPDAPVVIVGNNDASLGLFTLRPSSRDVAAQ